MQNAADQKYRLIPALNRYVETAFGSKIESNLNIRSVAVPHCFPLLMERASILGRPILWGGVSRRRVAAQH
ncbi:hypothetical protein GCM10007385_44040 [Tateyamaria omphalii]|nr:hypothetical protein GCM10007385_44040 [Tateyamaria omphalii]